MKRYLAMLFLFQGALAHGLILYNVSLDFNPELKAGVVGAANNYFNTTLPIVKFDYDHELLLVHYGKDFEEYAVINPVDFSVYGFRNDSLVNFRGEEFYGAQERVGIATQEFNSLPSQIKSELVYGGEKKTYSGTYEYTWYRYVNSVLVSNEYFKVEIDPTSGKIVSRKLTIFFNAKESIQIIPAISYGVAQKIAEIKFNAKPVSFEPVLIVDGKKPEWIVSVKVLYPIFVTIDAMTGEIIHSGNLLTELPSGYDYGREVPVVETSFVKSVYGESK